MFHIKDEEFIRGNVPMTKEEIRAISIAKLDIREDDVSLDIGAGTGSVSIEMANFSKNGKIYAVEINEEALDLIEKNIEKFDKKNIEVIKGMAPEVLPKIELDKIFIGGTKGNIVEIIEYCETYLKSQGKICLNFIVLENLFSAIETLKKSEFKNIDIAQISVSKNKVIGDMNMMMASNPVFIVSAERI